MKKIPQLKIISIGFLIPVCLALGIYVIYDLRLQSIPFSEQKNIESLGLIAIKNTYDSSTDITTYRLGDAKTQVFPGQWTVNFLNQKEALIIGAKADAPAQQYFITVNNQKAQIKDISQLPGPIIGVAPSQNGTYLLLNGIKKISTSTPGYYLCVTETNKTSFSDCRTVLGDIIDKKTQDPTTAYRAYWNKAKDNELIILEVAGQQRFWTYDVAYHTLKPLDLTKQDLPSQVELNETGNTTEYAMKRYGPLTVVKNNRKSKQYLFLSRSYEKLVPLGNNFALTLAGDKLFLIDMAHRTISEFATLPQSAGREIISYYR